MKITRNRLRQIIQEETGALNEQGGEPGESIRLDNDPVDGLRGSRIKSAKDKIGKDLEAFFSEVVRYHQVPFSDDGSTIGMAREDFHTYMKALLSDAQWPWNQVD